MVDGMVLRRTALRSVLLVLAAGLAGCDAASTSIAQGMAESSQRAESARLAAEGNPVFADPKLQAIVREFEADYARFGRDAAALEADAPTVCRLAPKEAYRLLKGTDYDEQQRAYAEHGLVSVTDLDAIEVRVVSGDCGPSGVEGPAEIVGRSRSVDRYGEGQQARVIVTDTVERIRATWRDGVRVGPTRHIAVIRNATFEAGSDGALEAQNHHWAFLNEIGEAPTASYSYLAMGPGYETEPLVVFTRNAELGLYGMNVTERRADGTGHMRAYNGKRLVSEGPTRNGRMHGWMTRHAFTVDGTTYPAERSCFQHGELVKSVTCPAD